MYWKIRDRTRTIAMLAKFTPIVTLDNLVTGQILIICGPCNIGCSLPGCVTKFTKLNHIATVACPANSICNPDAREIQWPDRLKQDRSSITILITLFWNQKEIGLIERRMAPNWKDCTRSSTPYIGCIGSIPGRITARRRHWETGHGMVPHYAFQEVMF